jgi:hypothetical protein
MSPIVRAPVLVLAVVVAAEDVEGDTTCVVTVLVGPGWRAAVTAAPPPAPATAATERVATVRRLIEFI